MERIAIMGLGPIGVSIGLALKQAELKQVEIVGFDKDRRSASQAAKMGAVDRATGVYRKAVERAQLIVLDNAWSDTQTILEAIAPLVEDGCVVTDTRATKSSSLSAATDILPSGIGFVGGHPLTNGTAESLEQASPELFTGIDYCIIPAESASQDAVGTVVGMVETIGAKPFFLDPKEHDTYVAAVTDLPTVLSYALVNATTASASWRDMARLASEEFSTAARLATQDPKDAATESLANKDALVHWIDQIIAELYSYRKDLSLEDGNLEVSFVRAWENHARWTAGAAAQQKSPPLPSASETMGGWLMGRRLWDRQRQILDSGKRDPWEYPEKK